MLKPNKIVLLCWLLLMLGYFVVSGYLIGKEPNDCSQLRNIEPRYIDCKQEKSALLKNEFKNVLLIAILYIPASYLICAGVFSKNSKKK